MAAALNGNQSLSTQITWKAWETEEVITKKDKISKPKRLKKHTGTVAKCMKRLMEKDIKNSKQAAPNTANVKGRKGKAPPKKEISRGVFFYKTLFYPAVSVPAVKKV